MLIRPEPTIRTRLHPGDVERIVEFHRDVYAREHGFDDSFADYVAGPLGEFAARRERYERIWIAEHDGRLVGCIAIVRVDPATAQLRWFLVAPEFRGYGLGTKLLESAVSFSRLAGYERVILWTESVLTAAARLYRAAGFERVEQRPGLRWGVEVVEEKYELQRPECRLIKPHDFGELEPQLRRAWEQVPPSRDGPIEHRPCQVEVVDGTILPRVYVADAARYSRGSVAWPGPNIAIARVAAIQESPERLPIRFADQVYDFGEAGMGYIAFTLVFADATRTTYAYGDWIDFPELPSGLRMTDIVGVEPHRGGPVNATGRSLPYCFCWFGPSKG